MFNLKQVRILYEFLMMSWSVLFDYLQLLPLSWFLMKNPQDSYQDSVVTDVFKARTKAQIHEV